MVLHPQRDSQFAVTTLTDWARARGLPVLGLKDEVDRLECDAVPVSETELVRRSTLVVGLGGDGTVLRALRLSGPPSRRCRCSGSTSASSASWPRSTCPSCRTR